MSQYVLDNSVAMRWLLASQKVTDQAYTKRVLQSFNVAEAIVPHLWHLEAINVLLGAERRRELTQGEVERFIAQLEGLPLATLDKDLKKAAKQANVMLYLAAAK